MDSLAYRLFIPLLLHHLLPLPSISLSLLFLSLPLHLDHRCSSSSLVYLFIVIGTHHRHRSYWYFFHLLPSLPPIFHPPPHPKKHFSCWMPSKRAKYLPKIPFFMRYSEICLIGGCLLCGVYQQRNKGKKVGTFQFMPRSEGCLISGCALVKLNCISI